MVTWPMASRNLKGAVRQYGRLSWRQLGLLLVYDVCFVYAVAIFLVSCHVIMLYRKATTTAGRVVWRRLYISGSLSLSSQWCWQRFNGDCWCDDQHHLRYVSCCRIFTPSHPTSSYNWSAAGPGSCCLQGASINTAGTESSARGLWDQESPRN